MAGFPGGSVVKNPAASVGDTGLIPGWGRSPGGGNGNPLYCSCLENPKDRRAWRATVHGVTKNHTTGRTHTKWQGYSYIIHYITGPFTFSIRLYHVSSLSEKKQYLNPRKFWQKKLRHFAFPSKESHFYVYIVFL